MAIESYYIENDKDFLAALDRLKKSASDFRIPFGLISKEFYRSNKKMFSLKGPGLYQDLAPSAGKDGQPTTTSNYFEQKKRAVGFAYPILVRSGKLAASLLRPNAAGAVMTIRKDLLLMGTNDPNAKYHQYGTRKMPMRKVVFIDGGKDEKSVGAMKFGRRETWLNIINDYILAKLDATRF